MREKMVRWLLVLSALLILLASCGKSGQDVPETDMNSQNPAEATETVGDPGDAVGTDDVPDGDDAPAERGTVLESSVEENLRKITDFSDEIGLRKKWEAVFDDRYYLRCYYDVTGSESFQDYSLVDKYLFFSENAVVKERECIAVLLFGDSYWVEQAGYALEGLLQMDPSPVTYHEENLFACYENGYYEFEYQGNVYCFMKKNYTFTYTHGEMVECTDVLVRVPGEEIPEYQIKGVAAEPAENWDIYDEIHPETNMLSRCLDGQVVSECLKLVGRDIDELAKEGTIIPIGDRLEGGDMLCRYEGMETLLYGGRDGDRVSEVLVPMSVVFSGDRTLDYTRIREMADDSFVFYADSYRCYTADMEFVLSANADTTLDMDGWCSVSLSWALKLSSGFFRDESDDELDGIRVPVICDEIAADFSAHGWENITIIHGSVDSAERWGIILDTTYGAEESHIYTVIGDIGEEYVQNDNVIHVVGTVIFAQGACDEWSEQPVYYVSDGGRYLDQDLRESLVADGLVHCREYAAPDETLYTDDEILPYVMYSD